MINTNKRFDFYLQKNPINIRNNGQVNGSIEL